MIAARDLTARVVSHGARVRVRRRRGRRRRDAGALPVCAAPVTKCENIRIVVAAPAGVRFDDSGLVTPVRNL
jgi:hypothetical protein